MGCGESESGRERESSWDYGSTERRPLPSPVEGSVLEKMPELGGWGGVSQEQTRRRDQCEEQRGRRAGPGRRQSHVVLFQVQEVAGGWWHPGPLLAPVSAWRLFVPGVGCLT